MIFSDLEVLPTFYKVLYFQRGNSGGGKGPQLMHMQPKHGNSFASRSINII